MPFGGKNSHRHKSSSLSFSRKKTYTVQDAPPGQKEDRGLFHFKSASALLPGAAGRSRKNTAPSGILKRGGQRPVSFPALEDGMVPQEMAAAVPMPREPELNELFAEMVVRVGVVLGSVNKPQVAVGVWTKPPLRGSFSSLEYFAFSRQHLIPFKSPLVQI